MFKKKTTTSPNELNVFVNKEFRKEYMKCAAASARDSPRLVSMRFEADICSNLQDKANPNVFQDSKQLPLGVLQKAQQDPIFRRKMVQSIWMEMQSKMLQQESYACAIPGCQEQAKTFVGTPACFLNPPLILDPFCVPVCPSQMCIAKAQQLSISIRKQVGPPTNIPRNQPSFPQNSMPSKGPKGCSFCGKEEAYPGALKKCSQCQMVAYCGKECQIQDWKQGHKTKCSKATTVK